MKRSEFKQTVLKALGREMHKTGIYFDKKTWKGCKWGTKLGNGLSCKIKPFVLEIPRKGCQIVGGTMTNEDMYEVHRLLRAFNIHYEKIDLYTLRGTEGKGKGIRIRGICI